MQERRTLKTQIAISQEMSLGIAHATPMGATDLASWGFFCLAQPQTQQRPEVGCPGRYHQLCAVRPTRRCNEVCMTLPHAPEEHNPAGVPGPPVPIPDEPRCPTCGAPWPPFPLLASSWLDHLQLAQDVLSDLRTALEEAVLP
jgi:hypothetical protein